MKLLLLFLAGVLFCSVWEARGGPRWRGAAVVAAVCLFAITFTSARLV